MASVEEGGYAWILTKDWATSESSNFYLYSEQIVNHILSKIEVPNLKSTINRMLVVVHPDSTADVYINSSSYRELAQVRVKEGLGIAVGQAILVNDITDIDKVEFQNLDIKIGEKIVYLDRIGLRFGIYFDLGGVTDLEILAKDVARLKRSLVLENILKKVQEEIKDAESKSKEAFVITEGKTDVHHLEKALTTLGFKSALSYERSETDKGDTELLQICKHLSLDEKRTTPVICIFDRDNPTILSELEKKSPGTLDSFQYWGNNVYSFVLPVPDHRKNYQNVSIEMLYSDEVIGRRDSQGKKLHFDNEIQKEIVNGKVMRTVEISPNAEMELKKKISSDEAGAIVNLSGVKVGLSKAAFAELIYTGTEPFSDVNFDDFKPVVKQIEAILADSLSRRKTN